MGQWQTTDSDLPRVTINNLPAGTYKAKFIVREFMSLATNQPVLAINDGTTTCEPISVNESNISAVSQTVECTFVYTNSGNRVFELYGASPSNTITVANIATAPRASTKFILEYFGSGSVYSSTNADTDWASCTPTSSQGFGTPTFAIQCKRQGSDLLMKGQFTSGVSTAVEARIGLPLWNGVQLVSAGSSIIPSTQEAGVGSFNVNAAAQAIVLIDPSVSYLNFGLQSAVNAGLAKTIGSGLMSNTNVLTFFARIPIAGWQNSNIIIGQFNGLESCTNTLECTDTFSAKISSAGVVSEENVSDFINGNCTVSPVGTYTCNFGTSVFSVAPNCTATVGGGAGGVIARFSTQTNTQYVINLRNNSDVAATENFSLICQKQGVDYVGRTALAVASDQNLSSPGTIKGTVCSMKIATSGIISDQYGGCVASCTPGAGSQICTFSSSYWAQTPNCTGVSTNNGIVFSTASISTTTAQFNSITGASGAANLQPMHVNCHGVRQ